MGSTMRKARVKYHGSTNTYSYEGLPPEPPQRRPRRRDKHPAHGTNQCCRVCYAEARKWKPNTFVDEREMGTRGDDRNPVMPPQEERISNLPQGALRRTRTRPSKGAMLFQLIVNSTGGQGGEGL